jgi:hypothetical protein
VLSIARGRGRYTFRALRAAARFQPIGRRAQVPPDISPVVPTKEPRQRKDPISLTKRALAEFIGTFWLVFEIGELPADMPTAGAPRESEI